MHVRLVELFTQRFGAPPATTQELRAHGSSRKLYRLHGANGQSAVGVEYDEREENAAFVGFTKHFRAAGLPVPEIYGEDLAQGVYLEEDLGDTTLFDLLQQERGQSEAIGRNLYEMAMLRVPVVVTLFELVIPLKVGR